MLTSYQSQEYHSNIEDRRDDNSYNHVSTAMESITSRCLLAKDYEFLRKGHLVYLSEISYIEARTSKYRTLTQ